MVKKSNRLAFLGGSLAILVLAVLVLAGCGAQSTQKTAAVASSTGNAAPVANVAPVANKEDSQCIQCHQQQSPGVVDQYHNSKHAQKGVGCLTCHKPAQGQDKLAQTHNGFTIVTNPTPNNCAQCHNQEVQQFANSRHAGRAWYPVVGAVGFTADELAKNHALDAGGKPLNGGKPNVINTLIGQDASALSCEVCHGIGKKNADGSFGDCTKCHLRHDFSVSQARQPETCAQCHLGPDHPQAEVYNESAHGAYYQANKDKFHLDAPVGALTTKDFPSPTCATCHMSAFGNVKGTHDVGERLKWNLAPPIANDRPDGNKNRETMQQVCLNCHSKNFVTDQFTKADKVVNLSNDNINKGQAIVDDLKKNGILTGAPMSTPTDFLFFELWHHEGRRARNGALMGGADYVNWHGIYEQKKDLVELQAQADELKKSH